MRNVIFLMLTLIMMSAASVKAQVRIGGLDDPNPSAVLDLNATNAVNNGKLGLALPRVELTSTASFAPLQAHVAGMTVYNTKSTGDVTPGTYYNDGSKWVRLGNGTLVSEVDGIVGNEVTNATANGGLERSGSGNEGSPYTLGIANNGVTTTRIADNAVTAAKLDSMRATIGQVLMYNGSTWIPVTLTTNNCSGAIVYNGAYNGPTAGVYTVNLNAPFEADWTHAVFTAQGRHLCWAAKDITEMKTWNDATAACANSRDDNSQWRLPTFMELHVLYEAIGGEGDPITDFRALDTSGNGVSNGASVMQSLSYWSSTEYLSDLAYNFTFYSGDRYGTSKGVSYSVRCVRSL
jgi:hypothetical protein